MKNRGFTLLEVLIALTLFAIVVTITTVAMRQSFLIEKRITAASNRLSTLQMALLIINRDTEQFVSRPIRGNDMHLFPAFIGQPIYLEFTRGGFVNPGALEQRATLQRIAYLCNKNRIIRRVFRVLDNPNRNGYQDTPLLDNVSTCEFAYMDHNQALMPTWAQRQSEQTHNEMLPKAIVLTVTIRNFGNMTLRFILPEGLYAD